MALVKFGAIVSAVSGKVSGNVFSHNKGGPYVKNWVVPTNPQTPLQQANRSTFSNISAAWRGLSQADRDSWIASAPNRPVTNRLGDQRTLSGYSLFMKQNMVLQSAAPGILTTAPVAESIPIYQLNTVAWDYGSMGAFAVVVDRVDGQDPLGDLSQFINMSISLPTSESIKPKLARSMGSINSATEGVFVVGNQVFITFTFAFMTSLLGPIVEGQQLLFGYSPLSSTDPWDNVKETGTVQIIF